MLKRKDLFSRKFTLHYLKIQCSLYLTLQLYSISESVKKLSKLKHITKCLIFLCALVRVVVFLENKMLMKIEKPCSVNANTCSFLSWNGNLYVWQINPFCLQILHPMRY